MSQIFPENLCSDILGESGLFAKNVTGFKARQPQQEMADEVAKTLASEDILVAEAGTGTGKTYAYLVPALLSGKKIIISTGTKNLQDQLYHRDLPAVRKLLIDGGESKPVKTALLKGRSNYLCMHRLELTEDQGRFYSRQESAKFLKIRRWSMETKRGDIAELTELDEMDQLWQRVTSTADNCLGQECPQIEQCHLLQARRDAQAADLIVVNHHLFFADMALKDEGFGELLPGANGVIFDEAHQLAETATSFFGERVGSRQFIELADDTIAEYLTDAADHKILQELADRLKKSTADFRLTMQDNIGRYGWSEVVGRRGFREEAGNVQEAIKELVAELEKVKERGKGLAGCAERGSELLDRFSRLILESPKQKIHWIELHTRGFVIHHTPLEIRDTFLGHIEGRSCGWIFTSATLAVDGKFDHFLSEFGLDSFNSSSTTPSTPSKNRVSPPKVMSRSWDSPFDFKEQSLFFHPEGLPLPNHPDYGDKMMEAMVPVIEASRGRTFLLFTSHRALRNAAEYLREKEVDYPLLVQGEAPRSQLLERFRELGNGVLLGASSFWEGVDVRGEALSCVIIDKFPFASPGDPVLQAKIAAYNSSGRNAFMELQLPRAVIALRQGAGRLIRDVTDRGLFVVCDTRMLKKSYGHTFLNSLPDMARTRSINVVERFFQK